ncbi:FAD assembly factor SdhE [Thalassolituus marinus]|jgi:antitoxin CptB|uniref:FAD assembly factor SdhE n=1 Tax=Thalassolituus marinus TaxID=671053 RepID=A0ABS7ZW78_9GAMM|nr:succinate dehydrogenase assembly factor 2 [Thalassolituus marinus]MCA6064666.1 succinate dehydrogenase assembly factor 2 [Thalassolituus marinus]
MQVADEIDVKRVRWHSRRGMLELDVLLVPFAEEAYADLSDDDQQRYRDLLEREDPDLFTWFMEHITPDDADMARIVEIVREHARSR